MQANDMPEWPGDPLALGAGRLRDAERPYLDLAFRGSGAVLLSSSELERDCVN